MRQLRRMKDYVEEKVLGAWLRLKSEKGQGLVEYAIILVLVAIAVIIALSFLAGRLNNVISNVGSKLTY